MDIMLALHHIAPRLRHLNVRITHAGSAMARMAQILRDEDGLDVTIDPYFPDLSSAIQRLAQARVVVGYGISDGISTTLLEAMAVGTFCIQASTACGCEWIRPGIDGLEVPPHDVGALAQAILLAVSDDALVDGAVARNRAEVERRWGLAAASSRALSGYDQLLNAHTGRRP
jgi:glycosyltransferase involved in cell wall biosynthesis